MCLSTVYSCSCPCPEGFESARELCSDISRFSVEGDTVRFIDLLGAEYEVKGRIAQVDFVKSRIYVVE